MSEWLYGGDLLISVVVLCVDLDVGVDMMEEWDGEG